MKRIYDFKKGDEIVRIEPAKPYGFNPFGGETRDRSYIGEKLIFVGILNGMIYLKRTDEFNIAIFGDSMVNLPLDVWDEGWEKWIDPKTLFDDSEEFIDNSSLEEKIKHAVEKEDYELAEKLRRKKDGK